MDTRLALALDSGMFGLPADGPIVVWNAGHGADLSVLPRDRVTVVQTNRAEVDALEAAGFAVRTDAPDRAALGIVLIPREKAAARAAVAEAARVTEGPVVIDGAKTDGIEGLLRDLRRRADLSEALSKHHGKLAVLAPDADLPDWEDPGPVDIGGFVTRAGIFSADGIDPGSALLADALPAGLKGRIADLGAGWGYLARAILARPGVTECHLVEADLRALDCARLNVTDPRARFHWADVTTFADAGAFDAVVTNPPFHQGRAGDPSLGQAFISSAARLLRKGGVLWLVANRHLPYEKALAARFGEVTGIGGDRSYKLFRAARPRQTGV